MLIVQEMTTSLSCSAHIQPISIPWIIKMMLLCLAVSNESIYIIMCVQMQLGYGTVIHMLA